MNLNLLNPYFIQKYLEEEQEKKEDATVDGRDNQQDSE